MQLPSIRTLQRITSKVANVDEQKFLLNVLKTLPEHQKQCILIWDEMYVKSAITYHGGSIFGKSVDCAEKLPRTVLAVNFNITFNVNTFYDKKYSLDTYKLGDSATFDTKIMFLGHWFTKLQSFSQTGPIMRSFDPVARTVLGATNQKQA